MDERKYYGQQCQDDKINEDFRIFHKNLVNQVIQFCIQHNITIDEFSLKADCLEESIKYGSWQACTDSSFEFSKFTDDYKDLNGGRLFNLSKEEIDKIISKQESFLFSM